MDSRPAHREHPRREAGLIRPRRGCREGAPAARAHCSKVACQTETPGCAGVLVVDAGDRQVTVVPVIPLAMPEARKAAVSAVSVSVMSRRAWVLPSFGLPQSLPGRSQLGIGECDH